jgi:hypothetical protein
MLRMVGSCSDEYIFEYLHRVPYHPRLGIPLDLQELQLKEPEYLISRKVQFHEYVQIIQLHNIMDEYLSEVCHLLSCAEKEFFHEYDI